MSSADRLRGLVGQSMRGGRVDFTSYGASYPPGSFVWTCPKSGYYRFVQWSRGGSGAANVGGASGSHTQTVAHINKGQTVSIAVPGLGVGTDCVVTLPSGRVITAPSASGVTPGAAPNGDVNFAGSAGGASTGADGSPGLGSNPGAGGVGNGSTVGGGAGAPGYAGFRGGDGSSALTQSSPGGGGFGSGGAYGPGAVIIVRQNGLIA